MASGPTLWWRSPRLSLPLYRWANYPIKPGCSDSRAFARSRTRNGRNHGCGKPCTQHHCATGRIASRVEGFLSFCFWSVRRNKTGKSPHGDQVPGSDWYVPWSVNQIPCSADQVPYSADLVPRSAERANSSKLRAPASEGAFPRSTEPQRRSVQGCVRGDQTKCSGIVCRRHPPAQIACSRPASINP